MAGQLEWLRRGRCGAPRDHALRCDRKRVAVATRDLVHLRVRVRVRVRGRGRGRGRVRVRVRVSKILTITNSET